MSGRIGIAPGWALWTTAVLRGAGFPAERVLQLAAPNTAAAADDHAAALERLESARSKTIGVLRGAQRSRPVNKAIKAIERGEIPQITESLEPASEALTRLAEAATDVEMAEVALCEHGAAEGVAIAEWLKELAREPRFREAVTWQNRSAIHGSIASYLRRGAGKADSKTRQQERLLAAYLQRYCVKNDTIGFFGPVGWAELGAAGSRIEPGRQLLESREVFFERWVIHALAAAVSRAPDLLLGVAPRRLPTVGLEGDRLRLPDGRVMRAPAPLVEVLEGCDGTLSARQLAERLEASGFELDEVLELLEELAGRGLIVWELDVPAEVAAPAVELRAALEAAGEPGRPGLEALDRLEHGRCEVEDAAGDPDRLDRSLAALEGAFEEITGESANRRAGEINAGRALVYEDTRRDITAELSAGVVDALAPALSLVLDSARWYSHQIAGRYRQLLSAEHRALGGGEPVDYVSFWRRVETHFGSAQRTAAPVVAEVVSELAARWSELIAIESAEVDRVVRTAAELAPRAAELFAAPGPGWPGAVNVSPDVLLAASAAPGPDVMAVLGEVHLDCTTLTRCLVAQHPDPDRLWRLRDEDVGRPRVTPVQARQFEARTDALSRSPRDYHFEVGRSRSWRPRSHVLTASELVVESVGDSLEVVDAARGLRFDVVDFLEQYLRFSSSSHFAIDVSGARQPRVVIDNLVVARQAWSVSARDLPCADGDRVGNFAAFRRWARGQGLPRWTFAKVAGEAKPVFVDLDSPIAVALLTNLMRSKPSVRFTEMLPDFDQLWLTDSEGARYTAELRLCAVDQRRDHE